MILGLAGIFGIRIYVDSQAVLLHQLNANFEIINVLVLLLACIMIGNIALPCGMFEPPS